MICSFKLLFIVTVVMNLDVELCLKIKFVFDIKLLLFILNQLTFNLFSGGTHKVVVMLPDGNLVETEVSPEEYASLELE